MLWFCACDKLHTYLFACVATRAPAIACISGNSVILSKYLLFSQVLVPDIIFFTHDFFLDFCFHIDI